MFYIALLAIKVQYNLGYVYTQEGQPILQRTILFKNCKTYKHL